MLGVECNNMCAFHVAILLSVHCCALKLHLYSFIRRLCYLFCHELNIPGVVYHIVPVKNVCMFIYLEVLLDCL